MSQFKRKLTAFTAMLAFLSLSSAATFAASVSDVIGNTNNVGFKEDGTRLDVNVNSGVAGSVGQVDWSRFNVGANEHVNFGFSGLSQTIINRVLGGQASEILGKLTNSCMNGNCDSYAQTSKVILINPAGIVFGAGSMVDLNSFTASTFDIKGAKNLKGMSESELNNYQTGVLNKFSPVAKINGENRNYGNITFDSNYTEAFEKAGINVAKGKTSISLDGATFAHFDNNGNIIDNNPNKSITILSDNIKYKDSLLRTGGNYNYGGSSFSNVKLITADGVTFGYLANGYSDSYKVADDTKTNAVRNIDINNSGLAADAQAIRSGDVHIVNKSNAANSNIKIANSVIKGTKLVNKENGDIMIVGSNDVLVDNSRLETINIEGTRTVYNKDGSVASKTNFNTENQNGGEVYISAGKNATVKNSLIMTAGTTSTAANAANAGAVRIMSGSGTSKVENSKIIAKNDVKVTSDNKVDVNNSIIQASNTLVSGQAKNVLLSAKNGVDLTNADIDASGNVNVKAADSNNNLTGKVNIKTANGGSSLIVAGDKLSIQGTDTKIDNANLVYDEIHFYNDGTTGTNNVTIANNTTFSPITSEGKVGGDINLETNGNFTLDNATMKRAAYTLKFDRNADDTLVDDGTAKAVKYTKTVKTADANNLNVTSTKGDVNVINKSNVHTKNDINLLAKEGNLTINNSTLKADHNINGEATKGALFVKDNAIVNANNDVTLKSFETITFGPQGAANVNIDKTAGITAGKNIYITSTNGDINAEKTTMPTLTYGERLTFNAKGDNNFTSEDSLKSVNVDYIAGKSNNFTTKGDIQFVNSSLKAPKNNITTTEEGGDVIMNNLTIKQATANAKDTITTIKAKGNVTTKDVTKSVASDLAQTAHKFPQDVKVNENGTASNDQVLDINQTKLVVNTKTKLTTPKNNTNGSITLDIKNAFNKDAGIELTAENEKWDGQVKANEGPEVHINAVDDKLAVSKIVTDKLFTDANDKMYAADVVLTPEQIAGLPEGTPSKGYIEVRDYMGFNQDNDFTKNPSDFDYTGSYVPGTYNGPDGPIDVNEKHTINFGDTDEDFILVYQRPTGDCPDLPDVRPSDDTVDDVVDSMINQIKIPREQVEISKTSKVSDNTMDQTSNIMSAAAKVDLSADGANSDAGTQRDEEKE